MIHRQDPAGDGKRSGIMQADVEHLHHRLLKSGLSTRRVATILCIVNGGLVGFGLLMATFQSHAYGIFLLALLAAVYVLLRHMAVIELRDTGKMLLTGLRRPTHAQLKALAYPVWDMVCLAGAAGHRHVDIRTATSGILARLVPRFAGLGDANVLPARDVAHLRDRLDPRAGPRRAAAAVHPRGRPAAQPRHCAAD